MAIPQLRDLARAARLAFPGMSPVVERHGDQVYTVRPTPWGSVGLFRDLSDARIWVAAETPPPPTTNPASVPPAIRSLAEGLGLVVWCRIETTHCASAIRRLGREAGKEEAGAGMENGPLLPPPGPTPVIGDTRIQRVDQLAALLEARLAGVPIPCLWGDRKVGKRAIAVEAATRANLNVRGELPLRTIVWDSVLQCGLEKVTETLSDLASFFTPEDVLLVSDAHLLSMIDSMSTAAVRDEIVLPTIADLPFPVILIATRDAFSTSRQVVSLRAPGLEGRSEVLEFVDSTYHGEVSLQRDAVDILMRTAKVENDKGSTIAPGRIAYLIDLAYALAPKGTDSLGEAEKGEPNKGEERKTMLVPDDIVSAASLVGPVWARPQAPLRRDVEGRDDQ